MQSLTHLQFVVLKKFFFLALYRNIILDAIVYLNECPPFNCFSASSAVMRMRATRHPCTVQCVPHTCVRSAPCSHTPHARWPSTGAYRWRISPTSAHCARSTRCMPLSLSAWRRAASQDPSCAASARSMASTRDIRYKSDGRA